MANISLGDLLVERRHISQAQLNDAIRWQRTHPNEKLSDILLSRGLVSEDHVLKAYADILGLRYIENEIVVLRPEILKLIPEQLVKKYTIMPVEMKGTSKIVIATSDPHDMSATEDVKMVSKKEVEIALCPKRNILTAIDKYYTNAGAFFVSDEAVQKTINTVSAATQAKMTEIESRVDNTPVVKLINSLVQQAYVRRA